MDWKISIAKMFTLHKPTYSYNSYQNPTKISAISFRDIDKVILKFIEKGKGTRRLTQF